MFKVINQSIHSREVLTLTKISSLVSPILYFPSETLTIGNCVGQEHLSTRSRTLSSRLLKSFVTNCGWGADGTRPRAESSGRSSSPANSLSICLSICTSRGAGIPRTAPFLATSRRHSTTCFSFFRKHRSSVSNRRHSRMPKAFRHQSMKLDKLSRAKNVPALAAGSMFTGGLVRRALARSRASSDSVWGVSRIWRAESRTALACWNNRRVC